MRHLKNYVFNCPLPFLRNALLPRLDLTEVRILTEILQSLIEADILSVGKM